MPATATATEAPFSAFVSDPESPNLTPEFIHAVGLESSQRSKIQDILQKACEEYLRAERGHTRRRWSEEGHLVVTLGGFSDELGRIERRFWQQFDQVANSPLQRSRARTQLNRYSALFPHGREQETLEMWTEYGWYCWRWRANFPTVFSGRQLSREVARFWRRPGRPPDGAADGG
jgi:hypothetical protein